jgi:hypothetical protein
LKKQMEAWTQNIKWMAETFGAERIGFLTLTVGDLDCGGRYRNLRDRKEAQRRYHSLMAGIIARRYQCGGTITERHCNGGIHFHLAVVCKCDIRGQIDFDACFPPKDGRGKYVRPPDYSTANRALREEWAFWRRTAKMYGFGRCQMQPVKSTGEAVGRYLAGYMMKDHGARLPEDKGARCVRMFGHWHKEPRKPGRRAIKPLFNSRMGWNTVPARVWREIVKQIVTVLNYKGAKITEQNIKDVVGPKWAWRIAKLCPFVWFVDDEWQKPDLRDGVLMHNREVAAAHVAAFGETARACWWHVTELTLEHLRGWTVLQKLLVEVQGDFWKGGEQDGSMANNKKRGSRRVHDRVSATDGWERPVVVADA